MKVEIEKRINDKKIIQYFKKGTNILHRDDGPAEIWSTGSKFWCQNDKFHREDGPAIIWSGGAKEWYRNGKLHREDGPAIVRVDGTKKYYLNDKEYSEEEFKERILMNELFFQEL